MTAPDPVPHPAAAASAPTARVEELLVPTDRQLTWQRTGLGVFFHVGVNTFAGLEWSDGTLEPSVFDPSDLDAEEWVRTAAELGAGYVVLTTKHHDGFCLWPTRTTDYSVASSPWREGRGDVVAEVAAACRRHGLGLGLYLSPWDRHDPRYPDAEAYDALYLAQLRELCTDYGELFELWFDGAGSAGRAYDWDGVSALIAELQPQAMVFNMGPATIRWVGNEDGLAADPVRYVTRSADLNAYDEDVLEHAEPRYLPPECDVSLRRGWFWKPGEQPKSLAHLLGIHERSIGLGAGLLLNVPPDRRGRIDPQDAARLQELGAALAAIFADPVPGALEAAGGRVHVTFGHPVEIGLVQLVEDLTSGQRVRGHRVLTEDGTVIASGGTVGVRRDHRLPGPVRASALVIELEGPAPQLLDVTVCGARDAPRGELPAVLRGGKQEEPR